jgi:hypothetical protein
MPWHFEYRSGEDENGKPKKGRIMSSEDKSKLIQRAVGAIKAKDRIGLCSAMNAIIEHMEHSDGHYGYEDGLEFELRDALKDPNFKLGPLLEERKIGTTKGTKRNPWYELDKP